MEKKYFDFTKEPGKVLQKQSNYHNEEPVISVIMPFYNDKDYIEQAVNSILNQTFSLFELLIIDDGSKETESLEKLKEIEKMDSRIRVLHKENEGLAATRDYGVAHSSESTKYLMILDSDDVIDETFLECAYWTLETNKKAAWAYSDSVGFGEQEYLWNKCFDSNLLKKENFLVATSLIRKADFLEVNGYELREKAVNEDWNFWLKLIAKGKFPVHMNYYGIWYRRKVQGELANSRNNKKRAIEIINETAKTITKRVNAIQYPRKDYNWDGIVEKIENMQLPTFSENKKINILMMVPWMVTGGADKFNLDLLEGLDKEKFNVTIITTEPNTNEYRQQFEKYGNVYDLTTFLDKKYWITFINSIIETRNINLIFNTNSKFGYSTLPYLKAKHPQIPIIDYIHMEEWYNRNGGYSRDSSMVSSVIDKTLLCNRNSQKVLEEHFKRKSEELETVYIGVDEKEYDSSKYNKEEIIERYKIKTDKKYIISYICRIANQKRPYLFMEILKELKKTRNDFLVLIVGDGNMLSGVMAKAKEYKLTDCIKFLGNISKTKEIYKISDITVNCSIKEGLALTSYESLAMGVPVVSSDVGGQKELINEEVGVIVPCLQKETEINNFKYKKEEVQNYVDAINKVLNNLQAYKDKCRKRILKDFTIDHMVRKMSNIFETVKNNPNAEKIENGKKLADNLEITKEVINLHLMATKQEYAWFCEEYYNNFYGGYAADLSIKDKLWCNPLWRVFVRFLQKTGIMKLIKNSKLGKKVKKMIE